MVSRDDVAKRAGVSGATVSYVLNKTPGVSISERTRRNVLKAVTELGYRPSLAGRALRLGRLHQIGMVVPSGDILFGAYHERLLRAAWRVASDRGYRLVLDALRPEKPITFFSDRAVDAVITLALPPFAFPPRDRNFARSQGIPVIMIGSGSWAQEFHTLDIDNIELGRTAADYLVAKGHRRFLLFGGRWKGIADSKRREGFLKRLTELGYPEPVIVDTPTAEPDSGYEVGHALLKKRREFTAAFCHNDNTAVGLIRAAVELGVQVPEELSVVGVDAAAIGQFALCRLTSFRQPLDRMGEEAVCLAIAPPSEPVHRFYPFELVEGNSVREV